MRIIISLFFSLQLFGQYSSNLFNVTPPTSGGSGSIRFYEPRAGGSSSVQLQAPALAGNLFFVLPNTGSPGAPGVYWGLCADSTNIFTWCNLGGGGGAFIDTTSNQSGLTGDKSTAGKWTFTTVAPELTQGGTVGGVPFVDSGRNGSFINLTASANAFANAFIGTTAVSAPVGTFTLTQGTNADFSNAYKIGAVTVINSSRGGIFTSLNVSGSATIGVDVIAGGAVNGQTMNANLYAKSILFAPTTNLGGTLGDIFQQFTDVFTVRANHYYYGTTQLYLKQNGSPGAGQTEYYDSTNHLRSIFNPSTGLQYWVNSSGNILGFVSTSGTGDGIGVSNGGAFYADGAAGIDLTCGVGTYLFQPVFKKGILTSGTCQP